MFYNNRKLTQYINYLRNIVGSEKLLTAVNNSWNEHYEDTKAEVRFFRMLEDRVDGDYYLKSINSEKYNEYGIAETFVVTMLELNEIKKENKGTTFFISSIALSESRIEIILSNSEATKIEDLGYVYPSIAVRNGDQGKNSFGFYSSLEFKLASRDEDGIIHFFPNKEAKDKTKFPLKSH